MHLTKAWAVGNNTGKQNGIGLNLSFVATGFEMELPLVSLVKKKENKNIPHINFLRRENRASEIRSSTTSNKLNKV